jgi:hypothetical protein
VEEERKPTDLDPTESNEKMIENDLEEVVRAESG